jgi:glucose/arabinose dehydrogenase
MKPAQWKAAAIRVACIALVASVVAAGATAVAAKDAPRIVRTEAHSVAVHTVAGGLRGPWGFALLPGGDILVTEKAGTLRVIRAGRLLGTPVDGVPVVAARGQGGLLDVAAHPDFARNQLVYLTYSAAAPGGAADSGTEVARGRFECTGERCALRDTQVIFRQQPKLGTAFHFGSRLVWARDGSLYVTLGDRGNQNLSQQLDNHIGKVLRIDDATGAAAPGNPFEKQAGARAEIFSYGNRNVQGAALHPVTGKLWAHEHGPRGGDELNIIEAGRNYGWPVITFGRTYDTNAAIGEGTERADVAKAQRTWVPSVAPSGLAFYRGDAFPKWRGNLFMGTLREQRLIRLTLDGDQVIGEERIEGLGRIRSVAVDASGEVYVLSESAGALYRLAPAR